jgi:phosphoribosylaminoimidazole-succinocarboxamide synthase
MSPVTATRLPLPLWRRGKVREVYEVDESRLLLVASDRVSAFDVVMAEPVPRKGEVLTQLTVAWLGILGGLGPHHLLSADPDEILSEVPALRGQRDAIAGRSMLVRRTIPVAFECVVRGYLAGSAWLEYRQAGSLAGEPLPAGLLESDRFPEPRFSPATKAESGHDQNVTVAAMRQALGGELTDRLIERSLALYQAGRAHAESRGLIIADTKFEFGLDPDGTVRLIDEVLTPDSSRFWSAAGYRPGQSQPSFDKQPLRDYLAALRSRGLWDGNAPPPALPPEVVQATSVRYLEAFRLLTGSPLAEVAACA